MDPKASRVDLPRLALGRIGRKALEQAVAPRSAGTDWWWTKLWGPTRRADVARRKILFLVCGPEPACVQAAHGAVVGGVLGEMGAEPHQVCKLLPEAGHIYNLQQLPVNNSLQWAIGCLLQGVLGSLLSKQAPLEHSPGSWLPFTHTAPLLPIYRSARKESAKAAGKRPERQRKRVSDEILPDGWKLYIPPDGSRIWPVTATSGHITTIPASQWSPDNRLLSGGKGNCQHVDSRPVVDYVPKAVTDVLDFSTTIIAFNMSGL
ncbi:hypothetical protein JB92DRAFT_2826754 [Gautieria morchelliformis]|nr:hypothetical protein JB92DRAFT_2826754 [Gautieria morchelliformis]